MKMRERERDRERGGCVTIVSHEIGIIISFTKTMILFFFWGCERGEETYKSINA